MHDVKMAWQSFLRDVDDTGNFFTLSGIGRTLAQAEEAAHLRQALDSDGRK
jgi:hypothetical protein